LSTSEGTSGVSAIAVCNSTKRRIQICDSCKELLEEFGTSGINIQTINKNGREVQYSLVEIKSNLVVSSTSGLETAFKHLQQLENPCRRHIVADGTGVWWSFKYDKQLVDDYAPPAVSQDDRPDWSDRLGGL
jgi:hypothetical protein